MIWLAVAFVIGVLVGFVLAREAALAALAAAVRRDGAATAGRAAADDEWLWRSPPHFTVEDGELVPPREAGR